MNRRFYILTLISFLCCLLIFTFYPSLRSSSEAYASSIYASRDERNSVLKVFDKKGALATMLCDPNMMEPTLVSIYSLNAAFAKKPSSKADIIVLIPESIRFEHQDIQRLKKLGTHVIRVAFPQSMLDGESNACSALINLWALFDYQKIVYFSPDVVFDKNVDQLFDYRPGSALSLNDDQNTPLFVLAPNPSAFESLVQKYRKAPANNRSFAELLQDSYFDYKLRIPPKEINENVHVFSAPMKPWNFHAYSDIDWKKHYDPVSFYEWRRVNNDVRRLLDPSATKDWVNEPRQQVVCDSYLQSVANVNHFPIHGKFSVMISTYNPERIERLSLIIRHLLKSDKVHTVFITWHNPALDVPATLYQDINEKDYERVKVLSQTFDSLNNRFNPVDELKTDAVYIMDDDIYVDLKDLEFTFSVWRSRKDSVVGHFPRLHTYDPITKDATYKLIGKAPYSIILTKSMFIRSDYLFSYTCLLEPKLHQLVDNQLNCEDLGFSMMASGMSNAASTFVRPRKYMEDFGLKQGISTNTAHMPARADCISDFITLFWNAKDPLVNSYDIAATFAKPLIRVGNWDRIEKTILG
ncbi:glycosyl transferase family 64 domain-containing protein [Parasitella parasitica]|nr:glycosyl transferase family 64 domain-containing protein [Parasitella parasitica]